MPTPIPIPRSLFKYLKPERIDVLTKARFRISQRQAVEDPYEFKPAVEAVSPDDKLRAIFESNPTHHEPAIIDFILSNPALKQKTLETTMDAMKTPDDFGMLCLSGTFQDTRMWELYAEQGAGFVIQFQSLMLTGKALFFDRVIYTNTKIPFLSEFPLRSLFFQKQVKWAHEKEWRGLMRLKLCRTSGVDSEGLPMHFLYFNPAAIEAIYVTRNCNVEMELRNLVSVDSRYRHVAVREV